MPENKKFWNPYRMVPVQEEIEKRRPLTHEKFQGQSGLISCTLKNLTPLFIGKNDKANYHTFLTRDGVRAIPGSSLKGMFRSLAEIVGGGCFVVTDSKVRHDNKYLACNDANKLCIACRMFGMMERKKGEIKVHEGNVSIGDALVREKPPKTDQDKTEEKTLKTKVLQILLANCGTRHEQFYRNPITGQFDGACRKFYFHQPKRTDSAPEILQNLQSRAWNIDAVLPGHHFDFEVQFSNLEKDEIALLFYVLALEDHVSVEIGDEKIEKIKLSGPLRHKIGNAKPLGLGSCCITINQLRYFADPVARFSSLKNTEPIKYEGNALKKEIAAFTAKYVSDQSTTMQHLRKMMVWDKTDTRDFRYPEYDWFKTLENSETELKRI